MYMIKGWSIGLANMTNDYTGIRITVTLKRRIQNELLLTYLPTVFLILITIATTHFKPVFFEAGLTVNLTNMLVLTTIFISVMERLPATAYVKMIDLWLITGQMLPFLEVVILTAKEKLRGEEGSSTNRKLIKILTVFGEFIATSFLYLSPEQVGIPLVSVLTAMVYVGVALVLYFD